jgi:DNA polymerase IV
MSLPHVFTKAILHVDGDAFFASCEVALDPRLKGKPVVTGKERGIASAMTYEAKALGVTRGMSIAQIRKLYPQVIIVSSDYETYALFSRRMYNIVRRHAPNVEEYSIDECFADLTGQETVRGISYEKIVQTIKEDLFHELGLTFSCGLAPTKVLAKVASKWKKPNGLTFIPEPGIKEFLKDLPIGKIWGIGPRTAVHLLKQGIRTGLEFAEKSESWVAEKLSKPHLEIWHELRGVSVNAVHSDKNDECQSVSRTRTFSKPSTDKEFVFSELSKNIEEACIRLRRHRLVSKEASFFIKTQDFRYYNFDALFSVPVSIPEEIIMHARGGFERLWRRGVRYRASGVTLRKLCPESMKGQDLFGGSKEMDSLLALHRNIDALSRKFRRRMVFSGSSLRARSDDENFSQKRLGIPSMGTVS